jgi:hypothetical protein
MRLRELYKGCRVLQKRKVDFGEHPFHALRRIKANAGCWPCPRDGSVLEA